MNDPALARELIELEVSLLRREVRASRAAVAYRLADDFLEFGGAGRVYDKALVLDVIAEEDPTAPEPVATDLAVRFLAPTVAMVTYCVDEIDRTTLRCSIWRLDNGEWRMAFHQGTPIL